MSWETRYQQLDTPWDKGAPAPPLVDLLSDEHRSLFGTNVVLVPGCGRGHDARAIAATIPSASVIGLDTSNTALEQARALDSGNSVHFQSIDFLHAQKDQFSEVSSIFEHTCFCAIDPSERQSYADSCARLLPPGAHWIAIIFLTPREEDDPTIGPPFQSSEEEIHQLFGTRFDLIESYRPQNAFQGRKGKEFVMIWQRNGKN